MKKILLIASVILALTLTACSSISSTPTAIPTIVLNAKPAAASSGAVSASAQVVPAKYVQLSFPLTGIVNTVSVKEGDTVAAGQTLVTLDTKILEAQVKQAEANVAANQSQVDYLKRTNISMEQLDTAQANVDSAKAALDTANATLAEATLKAPFNGTIASVDISPAETVVPGQVVIVMGDLSHFQIETTDLSERDVPNVKVGQSATVSIQALNQQFNGKVSDVSRISSTIGGDVVYKVTIELDQQPQGLRWGMTADVQIQTGQ
ncbi:MAG: efflux RND transporter periplasmic adaptor subunit [Chloroflexi bacterium]|nr:efflux RND transporter periplasmic adaptor subunit [Chloroflexota bacterium]